MASTADRELQRELIALGSPSTVAHGAVVVSGQVDGVSTVGQVLVGLHQGAIILTALRALERRGGYMVMLRVIEIADRYKVPIRLTAMPCPAIAGLQMSKDALIAWYGRFGFEFDPHYSTKFACLIRYARHD